MEVVRAIRFKIGEGAWSLEIRTYGNSKDISTVQLGFFWSDKPFPTHDALVPYEEFIAGLKQIGLIDATISAERESPRDTSETCSSPDEVFRAWSDVYTWPSEEPTTTRGESSGGRRSERTDQGLRGYWGNGD